MHVLLVEDDTTTADYLCRGLREEGHTVDHLSDGRDALAAASATDFDVMVLDRMLPGLDGLSLLKALRAAQITTPALFLTAMDGLQDRIEGLRAGGDDYLVKPFAFGELSARLDALARRPEIKAQETTLRVGDAEMDLLRRTVQRAGQDIELLPREFALLEALMRAKGRVLTRTMLLETVWGLTFDPQTNVVETHMSRLRAKFDKPFDRALITTVRGAGYRLAD